MRTTIPKITLHDDRPDLPVSDETDPESADGTIPIVELDSSHLEDRESELPSVIHDGLTSSTRAGAIAGPMGPFPGPRDEG